MRTVRRSTLAGLASIGVLAGTSLVLSAPGVAAAGPKVSAPAVHSENAFSVTPFDATLQARVTTENGATEYNFEYANKEALIGTPGATSVGSGTLLGALEELTAGPVDIGSGLTPATIYYYRVVATNASGTTDGMIQSFTTLVAEKPQIAGESSSAIAESNATLLATLNPVFQLPTLCEFQYATEEGTLLKGVPSSSPCAPAAAELGSGDGGVPVSAGVGGLTPNTGYYYRLFAANPTGSSEGAPHRFLTLPPPPIVITGAASALTGTSATIAGEVDPGSEGQNSDTTYWFQYGTNRAYELQIPSVLGDAGQGKTAVKESVELSSADEHSGLEPNTTYYYRIVASNDNANTEYGAPQLVYGEGKSFRTPATPPVLGPVYVGAVTQGGATITGTVDAEGLATQWELQLGSEPGALSFQAAGNASGTGPEPLTATVGSLAPGSTHYYKLVAVNPDGTVQSAEGSFTTAPAPPPPASPAIITPQLALSTIPFPVETGNIATEETSTGKTLSKAQKLANALKACAKKPKHKRAACKRAARARYDNSKHR
jgi:hypothetical protein